jgi:hypothetical protein
LIQEFKLSSHEPSLDGIQHPGRTNRRIGCWGLQVVFDPVDKKKGTSSDAPDR